MDDVLVAMCRCHKCRHQLGSPRRSAASRRRSAFRGAGCRELRPLGGKCSLRHLASKPIARNGLLSGSGCASRRGETVDPSSAEWLAGSAEYRLSAWARVCLRSEASQMAVSKPKKQRCEHLDEVRHAGGRVFTDGVLRDGGMGP